ncbi:MAG: thioredoxin domain-containing protein, partial [Devosia sp.]
MSRLSFALVLVIGLLAGGLGVSLLRPTPALDDGQVRGIITEMLEKDHAAGPAVAEVDPAKVNQLIEDYLMNDPAILDRMSGKLAQARRVAERQAQKAAIEANSAQIYDASGNVVLGNPDGDITLVEMFDYNCSYCRSALPDLATLMAEDTNLKVILKEFPILSQGSVDAARVAVLVSEAKVDYWAFHQTMFTGPGQNDKDTALKAAKGL